MSDSVDAAGVRSRLTRRAALISIGALGALGIGTVLGLRYAVRGLEPSYEAGPAIRLTDGDMMGGPADMSRYMEMFRRHNEISRTVEEIPGGVRTTTESNSP